MTTATLAGFRLETSEAPAWDAAAEQAAISEGWTIARGARGLEIHRTRKPDGSMLETVREAMSTIYHGQQPWHHAARAHLRRTCRPLWHQVVLAGLGF